jgi:hypothetical protein
VTNLLTRRVRQRIVQSLFSSLKCKRAEEKKRITSVFIVESTRQVRPAAVARRVTREME